MEFFKLHNLTLNTKKVALLCVVQILIFTGTFGQSDTATKKTFFAIKTDLVALSANAFNVVNFGSLTMERGFLNRHSFQVTTAYLKYIHLKSRSWSIIPEYKFFMNKKKDFKGFYTGGYLEYENTTSLHTYSSGSAGDKYITYKYHDVGVGLNFGYQTYLKKRLVLDFLVGIAGMNASRQVYFPADYYKEMGSYPVDNNYPITYLKERASINLGYKF